MHKTRRFVIIKCKLNVNFVPCRFGYQFISIFSSLFLFIFFFLPNKLYIIICVYLPIREMCAPYITIVCLYRNNHFIIDALLLHNMSTILARQLLLRCCNTTISSTENAGVTITRKRG